MRSVASRRLAFARMYYLGVRGSDAEAVRLIPGEDPAQENAIELPPLPSELLEIIEAAPSDANTFLMTEGQAVMPNAARPVAGRWRCSVGQREGGDEVTKRLGARLCAVRDHLSHQSDPGPLSH